MAAVHTVDGIFSVLKKAEYGTLSTLGHGSINSRIMTYACDQSLQTFFALTKEKSNKVREVRENPMGAFTILIKTDQPDDYSQTIVLGSISVSRDFAAPEVQTGLKLLAEKSPMYQMILDSASLDIYSLLVFKSREVRFSWHQELLCGLPETIVRF